MAFHCLVILAHRRRCEVCRGRSNHRICYFSLLGSTVWVEKPITYTVFVNEDGYGQPRSLFDRAQKSDPNLNLEFSPKELRNVYVCEFRKVTGPNYTAIVVSYLDAYRDCFDVSQRGESDYKIFPNSRTARLQQRDGAFFCKCDSSANR